MHQATRVRFRGGDPLALTKRIAARRPGPPRGVPQRGQWQRNEWPRLLAKNDPDWCGICQHHGPMTTSYIEARRPAHPYRYQAAPAEKVTPLRIAGMALLLLFMFVGIAITGPIFGAVVLR